MHIYLIPALLVLFSVKCIVGGTPCGEVSHTDCARDSPFIITEVNLDSEQDCHELCTTYAEIGQNCKFSVWSTYDTNCLLYRLEFSTFLSHCRLVGGPKETTGCDVENPADFSCDDFRQAECSYNGELLEVLDNVLLQEICQDFCKINPRCIYWTFRGEPSGECLLFGSDKKQCSKSFAPSMIDEDDCGDDGDVVLLVAGQDLGSVEVFGGSCSVPDYPDSGKGKTGVLTADGILLVCGGDADTDKCYAFDVAEHGWKEHSNTCHQLYYAAPVSLPSGVFMLGGSNIGVHYAEFLPTGTSTWQQFDSVPSYVGEGCSVAISDHQFLVIAGLGGNPHDGAYALSQVQEYNTQTDEWTKWPALDNKTYALSCIRLKDNVIVAGGRNYRPDETYAMTTIINIETKVYRRGGDLIMPRSSFGLGILNGEVFAFGGLGAKNDDDDTPLDTIEVWDETLEEWSLSDKKLNHARSDFAFITVPKLSVCK